MENIKITETLSDGTQKELCISDVINRFLYEKTKEYIGDTITDENYWLCPEGKKATFRGRKLEKNTLS